MTAAEGVPIEVASPGASCGEAPSEAAGEASRGDRVAHQRERARGEVVGFFALYDSCFLTPQSCAVLVRAWHALSSLEAAILDVAPSDEADFVACLRRGDCQALAGGLREVPGAFVAAVLAGARGNPGDDAALPSARDFARHRRVLVRALTDLEGQVRRRFPALGERRRQRVRTGILGAALFALAALALASAVYRPRWRVAYFSNPDLSGEPERTGRTLTPSTNWGPDGPAGLPTNDFSARFETCLSLARPETITFVVGSDDGSRLYVGDRALIDLWSDHGYVTLEQTVPLPAGTHRLRLDYYDRTGDARLSFAAHIASSGAAIDTSLRPPLPADAGCAPGRGPAAGP